MVRKGENEAMRTCALIGFMLLAGCLPARYTVVQDSNPAAVAIGGRGIFVSWLSLDPNTFAALNYSSAAEYAKVITTMNGELQKGLATDYPNKSFVFARSPADMPPPGVDVAVFFVDSKVTEEGGSGHSGMTLKTTVKFFDARSQREMRAVQISASTRGINGWSQYNQEACLEQCAYNAGNFVGETLSAVP